MEKNGKAILMLLPRTIFSDSTYGQSVIREQVSRVRAEYDQKIFELNRQHGRSAEQSQEQFDAMKEDMEGRINRLRSVKSILFLPTTVLLLLFAPYCFLISFRMSIVAFLL